MRRNHLAELWMSKIYQRFVLWCMRSAQPPAFWRFRFWTRGARMALWLCDSVAGVAAKWSRGTAAGSAGVLSSRTSLELCTYFVRVYSICRQTILMSHATQLKKVCRFLHLVQNFMQKNLPTHRRIVCSQKSLHTSLGMQITVSPKHHTKGFFRVILRRTIKATA